MTQQGGNSSSSDRVKKYLSTTGVKSAWSLPPKWLKFLIVVLLLTGIFFRFVNLNRKVYAVDEVYTSLRISGYTEAELVQQVSESQVVNIQDLQKYQQTNSEKDISDTVQGLVREEPQLTPLYFIITRFWVEAFGNSVAVTRSLSVLINCLAFPCLYWLCVELFELKLTSWVAIALFAVSPFQVLYAQEARSYSLWTVTILLSSTLLLRAIRLNKLRTWIIYALSVVMGLYTFLYFALVVVAHGIYVLGIKGFRKSKIFTAYLLACIAGFLAFLPWIVITSPYIPQMQSKIGWQNTRQPLSLLVKRWLGCISRNFVDLNFKLDTQIIYLIPFFATILVLLAAIGYSTFVLCRRTPKKTWLFILTLILVPTLALTLPDVVLGGSRSMYPRYLVPFYLGSQLAIAYLLATKITSANRKNQRVWQLAMVMLLSLGVVSCAGISQADAWWNKYSSSYNYQISQIINSTPKPLLITVTEADKIAYPNIGNLISLSYLLEPKVQAQLVVEPKLPAISKNFSDIFLIDFLFSDYYSQVLNEVKNKYNLNIEPVFSRSKEVVLYKLK